MITADTLKTLTTFTAPALSRAIQNSGHKNDTFTGTKFLGMTNGGQFCYLCTYKTDDGIDSTKVFLNYNPSNGSVSATY